MANGSGQIGTTGDIRFSRTRGRIGPDYGLQYPSPFFDIAQTYLPATIKQMFRWCRYYFLVHPLINAVIFKMSEYPVTDILFDTDNERHKRRWQEFLLGHLRYRAFQVEVGLDYFTYGNSLVSIFYPFVKLLECTQCGFRKPAKDSDYGFRNFQFMWTCPKCGINAPARPVDHYLKAPNGIRLIRWNPEDVDIRYNELTGEYTYYYEIPVLMRNDIIMGKKSTVESVPQLFIDALRLRKSVVFSRENIFHFKRPTLAGKDRGWGTPLILPVLKDCFYLQIMRKAQEAVLLEHVVPLRILFPQAGSASADPYTAINLGNWRDQVAAEIRRWRADCVTPTSLVETNVGLVQARDVTEDMRLKDRNGRFEKIVKKWERPLRPEERAYQLKMRGLAAVDTVYSENHPIWAARSFNKGNGHKIGTPEMIEVKDLRVNDYVGYPISREVVDTKELDLANFVDRAVTPQFVYVDHPQDSDVPTIFEHMEAGKEGTRGELLEQNGWGLNQYKIAQMAIREGRTLRRLPRLLPFDEELAWVVGLYLAEGSTTTKQIQFSLHADETEFRAKLDRFFFNRFGVTGFIHPISPNGIQYIFSSKVAAQFFSELCPGTALTKSVPAVYRHAPDKYVLPFLQGLIDGDGTWYDEKTTYNSSSRQLAEDVRQLFLSLGIIVGISSTAEGEYCIEGKTGVANPSYKVQASGPNSQLFRWMLGMGEKPTTVWSHIGEIHDGYLWHRINGINQVEAETVIGFEMEGDQTFCTWGVATHNSNYIPILPLPIGNQSIGGDGRALMLTQELRVWSEQIVAGMGVPNELIFGGLSYSGSNVSLRMLENTFLGYLQDHKALLNWVVKKTAAYLDWETVGTRFKPFKLADDLQRKAFLFQLNQANKISDDSLLADSDFDSFKEDELIAQESTRRAGATKKARLLQAEIEGETQLAMSRWQQKAQRQMMQEQSQITTETFKDQAAYQAALQQQMMQNQMAMQQGQPSQPMAPEFQPKPRNPGAAVPPQPIQSPLTLSTVRPPPPGAGAEDMMAPQTVDLQLGAQQVADYIHGLSPVQQPLALREVRDRSPELYDMVLGLMGGGPSNKARVSAARPLPLEKPPRRGPEAAII